MTAPLTKTEAAIASARTVYQTKVKSVSDGLGKTERVIKASTNKKLGKRITRGKFKGFPLYTVTLQERATCPATCVHWETCYGNNMPFATRYAADAALVEQMERELIALNKRHPGGFVVRLHILGDFFSVDYVARWSRWLAQFPALNVYGYSARMPNTPIGAALETTRTIYKERFAVRFSGLQSDNAMTALSMDDPETVAKVEAKQAFVCPVQTDKASDCGACTLCWASKKPVAFITH